MRTGRTGQLGQEEVDDVLRLAGALGVDIQGVVQEKDEYCEEVDKWDEVEEVDEDCLVDEDRDCETSMDWDEVEEVKVNDTLDDIPFSLDETVKDILDEPEDKTFEIGEEIHGAGPDEGSLKWWRERVDALEKEADQNMVDEDDNDANIVEVDGDHEDESVDKKLDDDQLVDDQVDQGGDGKKEEEDEEEELDQSSCITMIDNFINSVRDPSSKKIATTTDQCEDRNEYLELMGKGLKDGADGEELVNEDLGSEAETPSETKEAEDIVRPNIDKSLERKNPRDDPVPRSSQSQTSEKTSKGTSPKGVGGLFNCPLCLFIVEKKARLPEHLLNSPHYHHHCCQHSCHQPHNHTINNPPLSGKSSRPHVYCSLSQHTSHKVLPPRYSSCVLMIIRNKLISLQGLLFNS